MHVGWGASNSHLQLRLGLSQPPTLLLASPSLLPPPISIITLPAQITATDAGLYSDADLDAAAIHAASLDADASMETPATHTDVKKQHEWQELDGHLRNC